MKTFHDLANIECVCDENSHLIYSGEMRYFFLEGEGQQVDCFTVRQPVKVSAVSLLGQLV